MTWEINPAWAALGPEKDLKYILNKNSYKAFNMPKPKKILLINSSLLKESGCLRRVWLLLQGYKSHLNNNDIEFGSAFHIFKSTMRQTNGDYMKAKIAAMEYFKRPMIVKKDKSYLTPTFLLNTCINYWEKYYPDDFEPVRPDGKDAMVEVKFSIPYMQTDEYEVLLQGTWDEIGKIKNGCYALSDCKTTSSWNWSEYLRAFELSHQLMFYHYCLQKYAVLFPNSIYAEICKSQVGVFVDGIFYGSTKETEFKRSRMFYYSKDQMSEFELILHAKITGIISMLITMDKFYGGLPYRDGILVGACETKYGRCGFFNVCASPDNIAAQHILNNDYVKVPFNPLDH